MVGSHEAWVIPMMPKMSCQIEGVGDSEDGGQKTMRWFPYIEELDMSNSTSFVLMPIQSGSVGEDGRCTSPLRNL